MIASIIGGVIGLAKGWFEGRKEESVAKRKLKLAELENKARLMLSTTENNHSWEMANLADKDKSLRRFSFLMFSAPFIVAIFFPHHVNVYFEHAIAAVPAWWQKTFMAINGGIWGISSLKNVIPGVVDFFKKKSK